MVPAHCAHQVCNANDSIKIACDFVSPREFHVLLDVLSDLKLKGSIFTHLAALRQCG